MDAGDDIEAFVLTRNRVGLLRETVDSLLAQSLKGLRVTIVDNASDDGTPDYAEALAKEDGRVFYFRQKENVGVKNNLYTAVSLARATYALIFHDDDLLHPRYLEMALRAARAHPNISLVMSNCVTPAHMHARDWEDVCGDYWLCRTPTDVAAFIYGVGRMSFPSVVYKTEFLKSARFRDELFGKIADKPFVQEAAGTGGAVVFKDKRLLRYRVHAGQDTKATATGPFYEEIIRHNRFFKDCLKATGRTRRIFALRCHKQLKSLYKMGGDATLPLRDFVRLAEAKGAGCRLDRLCNLPVLGALVYPLCNAARGWIERGFPCGNIGK